MIYSISDVSSRMNIEERTLKYYAKEGLLPLVEKTASGALKFKINDFEWLELLTSLRNTGVPLSEIKVFADVYSKENKNITEINDMLKKYKITAEKHLKEILTDIDKINGFIIKNESLKTEISENEETINEKNIIASNRREALVRNFTSLALKQR